MVGCERKPLVWGSAFARALFILWRRLALGHNSNHRRVLDKVDIEERVVVNLDALVVTLPAAVEIMKVLRDADDLAALGDVNLLAPSGRLAIVVVFASPVLPTLKGVHVKESVGRLTLTLFDAHVMHVLRFGPLAYVGVSCSSPSSPRTNLSL